jgi:hypothetical protein
VHRFLNDPGAERRQQQLEQLLHEQEQRATLFAGIALLLTVVLAALAWTNLF